jgi:hypothetical protein
MFCFEDFSTSFFLSSFFSSSFFTSSSFLFSSFFFYSLLLLMDFWEFFLVLVSITSSSLLLKPDDRDFELGSSTIGLIGIRSVT